MSHGVPVYFPAYDKLYCLLTEANVCEHLFKVALAFASAGIEAAISNRKSNAITTTPPSNASYFVLNGTEITV